MKHIVFVIESLHLGGAEKCLVTLLNQMDYSAVSIDLILFKKEGIFLEQVPCEVNVMFFENKKLTFYERILFFLKKKKYKNRFHNAQILWEIISNKYNAFEKKYDVVVAYNQGFATYFASKYLCGKKKISWLNTNYKLAGYNIDYDYPIYKKFDVIVAVSNEVEAIFRSILEEKQYELNTTTVIDIIDDLEILTKASKNIDFVMDSSIINIVSVGRLAKPKAFDLAIEACNVLVNKGYLIKWYVVGEGNERKYLENLITKYKLNKTFILLGQSNNPYPYMLHATVFAQTSIFEGLGTTIIEAAILNKPIVSTNFPSIYSIIQDEETGLIAEMNPESIANKIERLLLDENLRAKLSNNLSLKENNDKVESLRRINELFSI